MLEMEADGWDCSYEVVKVNAGVGDGVALEPQNNEIAKELLSKVSSYCKL